MDPHAPVFWIPAHVLVGMAAYLVDRRGGVALRGWLRDLCSPEPSPHQEGFLVARGPATQLVWAAGLSAGLAGLMVLTGAGQAVREGAIALVGTLPCFLGMQLARLGMAATRGLAGAGARFQQLQGRVLAEGPGLVEDALVSGHQVAKRMLEDLVPEQVLLPAPDPAQLRQQRIQRMDELLAEGRRREEAS